jgi:hypothetical protein
MTTVLIELPDQLAREADGAGLLTSGALERLLRERLKAERVERLRSERMRLASEPKGPMTLEELQAEVAPYGFGQQRAAG